jgi:hypothetical protein
MVHISQEVGAERKVSNQAPLTLMRIQKTEAILNKPRESTLSNYNSLIGLSPIMELFNFTSYN